MDLEWQNRGRNLVAKIDCRSGPAALQGGGSGWYEVTFIDWRLDWKLRVQVSVTQLQRGYGGPSREFAKFAVNQEIAEVIFPIPDCIYPFANSGWGCSEGELIPLTYGQFHCQALLQAKPPSYRATLGRSIENRRNGITFLEGNLTIQRVNDLQRMTLEQIEELLADQGLTRDQLGPLEILTLRNMGEEEARRYLQRSTRSMP